MGEMPTTQNASNDSSVIAFIYEYEEKKQRNGLFIKEEITALTSEINGLKTSLEKMEKVLKPHQYSLFDDGGWEEYYDSEIKKGKIDEAQQKKIKEFQEEKRKIRKEKGTEVNFEKL